MGVMWDDADGWCTLPVLCAQGRIVHVQVLWNTILCKIATNKSTEIVLEPNPHLEQHQPAPA
jgi:hypothetical protein